MLMCAAAAFVTASWYRPAFGLAGVLGLTLLFEQYDFAVVHPITRAVPFFENASKFTGIKGLELNPLEMLLVVLAAVVLARITSKHRQLRGNPLAAPVVAFMIALALWLLYGLVSGGGLTVALWELRGFAYFGLLVLLVPQIIDSERDIKGLLWVAIIVIFVKACQGLWNAFVALGGDLSGVRSITGHEDALFIACMGVFLIALLAYRAALAQRVVLVLASPFMAATFVLTDRRAAFVAFALGLVVLSAFLAVDKDKRMLVVKFGVPVAVVFALVVVAGWNSDGILGVPAQTIKSITAPQSKEDADSSYYRRAEEVNLVHAVESSPIIGLGFGRPFQQAGQGGIVDIGFTLENVIPHNEIVWVWAKMGTVGFALFWAMFGGIIAWGGLTFRLAETPYAKAVALLVTCAVMMQLIVSYVDLQLTYARNMVFLGVLVGALAWLAGNTEGELADDGR